MPPRGRGPPRSKPGISRARYEGSSPETSNGGSFCWPRLISSSKARSALLVPPSRTPSCRCAAASPALLRPKSRKIPKTKGRAARIAAELEGRTPTSGASLLDDIGSILLSRPLGRAPFVAILTRLTERPGDHRPTPDEGSIGERDARPRERRSGLSSKCSRRRRYPRATVSSKCRCFVIAQGRRRDRAVQRARSPRTGQPAREPMSPFACTPSASPARSLDR